MQYNLGDNLEDYRSLDHEYLCDLLSNIKVKDNRKSDANQIKRFATSREESNYYSDEYVRVPHNNRVRTGVIPNRKHQGRNMLKHHGF